MTLVLPAGFRPLPFNAALGLPQQVRVQVGRRALTVTLVALTADIVGALTAEPTRTVVDGAEEFTPREAPDGEEGRPDGERGNGVRTGLTASPPGALDTAAVRPYLVVLEAGRLIGSAPVVVGRPLAFGSSAGTGLVIEILVAELVLAAGALVEPAEVGSRVLAGFREHGGSAPPPARLVRADEGSPYDLLV
ncbi:hypothetical protein [Streptomyces sp. NPDC047928]|uniref:hypothetical protein n=1 Tax=unclassified Streptomyces TaxID=2593676 RepID=UPI00371E4555